MGSSSMDSKASAIVRPGAVRQAQHMLVEGRGSTSSPRAEMALLQAFDSGGRWVRRTCHGRRK